MKCSRCCRATPGSAVARTRCGWCCRCRWCVVVTAAACSRHRLVWRRGLLLLVVAAVLSLAVPRAPLSHLLLSKDNERRRLLAENELRFQHSQRFLQKYRASMGLAQPVRAVGKLSVPRPAVSRDVPVLPPLPATGQPLFPVSRNDNGRPVRMAEVGVTVMTMARGRRIKEGAGVGGVNRYNYLTQSVARILELLNDTQLTRSYSVRVCNVDDHPESFLEGQELEDVVPTFRKYGNGTRPPKPIWEKLKFDYVYCLQQTMAQEGVRYGLIVEDDGFAHEHLFRVLENVLDRVVEAPGLRPVTSVKLYHPHRLLGYISLEKERLPELFCLAVVVGAVLTLFLPCRGRLGIQYDLHNTQTRRSSVRMRWAGWCVVVAVLALAVGRLNLLELRRLSPHLYQVTPTASCCTVALLYTQHGAANVSNHLLSVKCTAARSTDTRMDEFRKESGARCLMVQPNLFTHIGVISSLRTEEVNPLIVE